MSPETIFKPAGKRVSPMTTVTSGREEERIRKMDNNEEMNLAKLYQGMGEQWRLEHPADQLEPMVLAAAMIEYLQKKAPFSVKWEMFADSPGVITVCMCDVYTRFEAEMIVRCLLLSSAVRKATVMEGWDA
jgi:hypothetical protein